MVIMIFTNIKYIIVHVVFSIFSQKMYEIIQYYVRVFFKLYKFSDADGERRCINYMHERIIIINCTDLKHYKINVIVI